MEPKVTASEKRRLILVVVLACVAALLLSLVVTLHSVETRLDTVCADTDAAFTSIMNQYTHSFCLFEELLQQKN